VLRAWAGCSTIAAVWAVLEFSSRNLLTEERLLVCHRWQRFCARLGTALQREGRALGAGLRDPLLWVLVLVTLLLATLACQVVQAFALDIGQRPEEAYLTGFHDAEEGQGRTYRWSRAESAVDIPALGQAPYRLDLTMAAPRPNGVAAPGIRLAAGGRPLLETVAVPPVQVYSILLPAADLPGGNLDLVLQSEVFTPTGDPRPLGVMLDRLAVVPAGRPVVPPWETLLWTGLTVLLAVLLARRLGWSRWIALTAGAALALLLAALLTWGRPLLAPALPFLPLGLACAWLLVALFQGSLRNLFAWSGAALNPWAERALWTAVLFFFVVRLAGSLHPAYETWDLCFHYHRLESVTRGQVLFTIESGEWRGLTTLYLPSPYLLLAPFWAIFGGRLVPFEVFDVLLDTSAALLVAYIARRLLGRGQAAPWAALLYLTMPQSYIIFSWGIVANILGQWLFLLLVALAVSPAGWLARWRQWLLAVALLLLAVLAHPGTVLLTVALLGALVVTAGLAPLKDWPRPAAGRWALAGVLALVLTAALYYSYFAPTMWDSLQQMGQGANVEKPTHGGILVRGQVNDPGLGLQPVEVFGRAEAVLAGARELAAEARAYYHTAPLVLALAALVGLALERRALAVRLAGLAFVIALLFAVVGLVANLYVRFNYFLLPFVAIGAAWWLVRLSRHGWAGRAVVALASLYLLSAGLVFWVQRVLYYSAGCR
jgi:hypothetical protein